MKVFEFDPATGRKGALIGESIRPDAVSNRSGRSCALPKAKRDENWMVATTLADRRNHPITFDRPVCFCLGQFTAGTDTAWEWVAFLPEDKAAA
jgi:hypothetical protein